MKKIKITDKQHEALCAELSRLLFKIKESKVIECVYFTSCCSDHLGNVLRITLVKDEGVTVPDNWKISALNERYERKENLEMYGVSILFNIVYSKTFRVYPVSADRKNELFNSTILFDRTGEYQKMSDIVKRTRRTSNLGDRADHYRGLAQIIPPIEEKIIKMTFNS